MKRKNFSSIDNLIILLILSTFCIPAEFRMGISERIGMVNYLAIIILIFIIIKYIRIVKLWMLFYVFLIEIYYLYSSTFYEKSLSDIMLVSLSFIVPLLIISIEIKEREFKRIFNVLIKTLNIFVFIIVIIGIIEIVFKINIMLYISKFMSYRIHELISLRNSSDVYRLYSIMGHPLFNTQIILMFYILNNIYSRYYGVILNNVLVIIISLIGISLTASKIGLVLILFSILLFNYKKINFSRVILYFFMLLAIFKLGIFNNTIERFLDGGLTTGREGMWNRLESYQWFPIKFFTGYGNNFTFVYNNYMNWASAAFEYPFRKLSLEHGIIFMALIYSIIALYPMALLIKRRQVFLLVGYIIVFIDINTYNGLALNGDYMLIFVLFIFIIMNMSKILVCGKEVSINENSILNT